MEKTLFTNENGSSILVWFNESLCKYMMEYNLMDNEEIADWGICEADQDFIDYNVNKYNMKAYYGYGYESCLV